jgi:hypothetical protein
MVALSDIGESSGRFCGCDTERSDRNPGRCVSGTLGKYLTGSQAVAIWRLIGSRARTYFTWVMFSHCAHTAGPSGFC